MDSTWLRGSLRLVSQELVRGDDSPHGSRRDDRGEVGGAMEEVRGAMKGGGCVPLAASQTLASDLEWCYPSQK